MNKIWYSIYNFIGLPILFIVYSAAGLFNTKIRKGYRDRKILFENLAVNIKKIDRKKKLIWFHSASMGEFEQAKPIIERLKSERDVNILVTFFSPSGYRNSRKYPYADVISYLPLDSPGRVKRFLEAVRPDLVVFMRYDFWPNLIWQLSSKKIPTLLVDATLRKDSKRIKPFAKSFHQTIFKGFAKILTVSDEDAINFEKFDGELDRIKQVGDTRFDRVYQKSMQAKEKKLFMDGVFDGKKVFLFGSSWESDEEVVMPALFELMEKDKNIIMIIAPHEPTILRLEKIENSLPPKVSSIRFSFFNNYNNENVIIIDSIGILLTLYYYCNVAYVGGSFKQGIHNVLEPAVYGIPVLYGPKIQTSQEAMTLADLGGGQVVRNKNEAYQTIKRIFENEELRKRMGKISYDYVQRNIGATGKILEEIYNYI